MTEHEDRSTDAETLPAGPVRRPGRELAAARERAGISFETMAEGLRLPKRQLEALEADDYASLPPPAYVRGYIRAYAREVGLDGDDIVALFDADHGDLQDPDLHPATPQGAAAGVGKGLPVGLAVIALVVVAGVGGWWWQGRPPADTDGAGETPSAAESSGQTAAGTAPADGEAIAAADAGGSDAAGDATAEGGSDNGAGAGEDPGSRAEGARADDPGDGPVAGAADAAGATATPTLPEPDEAASSQPAAGPDDDAAAAGSDPGETATASAGDTADDATDTDATGSATAGDEDAVQDDAGGTAAGATDGERLAAAAAPEATGEEQDAADTDTDEGTVRQHDSPSATSDPGEAATPAAAVGPDTLELHVDGRSWVEVYDAGERELVYTLYLGSEPVRLRGWAPFDVFLGNSPAVTVVFNGQEVAKSAFTRSDNTARFLIDTDGARRR